MLKKKLAPPAPPRPQPVGPNPMQGEFGDRHRDRRKRWFQRTPRR